MVLLAIFYTNRSVRVSLCCVWYLVIRTAIFRSFLCSLSHYFFLSFSFSSFLSLLVCLFIDIFALLSFYFPFSFFLFRFCFSVSFFLCFLFFLVRPCLMSFFFPLFHHLSVFSKVLTHRPQMPDTLTDHEQGSNPITSYLRSKTAFILMGSYNFGLV